MNNYDMYPTADAIRLFAYRLYNAERTIDVNIKAQKTPVLLLTDKKQELTLKQLYMKYDGNYPFIFGDKNLFTNGIKVECIKTEAPFISDKLEEYKKEVWNEALTYLGINNIIQDKKERLINEEASSNNELINYNLQSDLITRKKACKQFNELFNENIDVKVRSDLYNIIKQELNSFPTIDTNIEKEEVKEE